MADEPEPMQVPFAVPDISDGDVESVVEVLRSGWITTGAECDRLESDLSDFLGVDHVVAMSSCTAALETTLAFLDLPAGARVGVPTWTFVASALAPARHGCEVVLLDIEPDDFNISATSLAPALDDGLDAVIGVHFGGVAFSETIHDLCRDAGTPLIEDAAHALGTTDHRGLVAGQGTAGACFSFYATKNLTSSEGGAVATDDERLATFARSYRLHGLSRDAWARYLPDGRPLYDLVAAGIKGNLPDVLAALARSQLQRFPQSQAYRRELVERYRSNLAGVDGLRFVPTELDRGGADHLLVTVLPEGADRARVIEALGAQGVGSSIHFQPLHTFDWFKGNAEIGPSGTSIADEHAHRALSLPLHTRLSIAQVDHVSEVLAAALRG